MKLKKENWKKAKLSDVCEKVEKIDYRKQYGIFSYIDIGSINSDLNRINEIEVVDWKDASSRARQIIKKNDTLFSTVRVNLRRVAIIVDEIPDGIASTGFTVLRAKEKVINPLFLFYSSITPTFLDNVTQLQVGTAYPAVTDRMVLNQDIYLPPFDEQQSIVRLFQSLEQSILRLQEQDGNLKALRRRLADGLASVKPVFGNLLSSENCRLMEFKELTDCIEQHEKAPLETGLSRYIGLENIETDDFTLQGFGNIEDGTTFTKRFSKGDVLFGKRRAYLRKVAIADFDGICSSDILVFRAKSTVMLPGLLPYYVSSNAFMNFAVSTSAGSLSPRTKWRDLASYELSIPDLITQEKIVGVFNQLDEALTLIKTQIRNLKTLKQKLLNEILG